MSVAYISCPCGFNGHASIDDENDEELDDDESELECPKCGRNVDLLDDEEKEEEVEDRKPNRNGVGTAIPFALEAADDNEDDGETDGEEDE